MKLINYFKKNLYKGRPKLISFNSNCGFLHSDNRFLKDLELVRGFFLGKIMQQLIEQVKRHEGLRLKPYRCTANKLTIGWGRNMEDSGISHHEAELMLKNDLTRVRLQLISKYAGFTGLDEIRQDVLINMSFNLGFTGLMQFKNMQAAISRHDYKEAAAEMMDSRWARQVGRRAEELSFQMEYGIRM